MYRIAKKSSKRRCSNCMHAYSNEHTVKVWCSNQEFAAQTDPEIDGSIEADGLCDMWTPRRKDQPKLDFHKVIQLELF